MNLGKIIFDGLKKSGNPAFYIGTRVEFSKELVRAYHGNNMKWKTINYTKKQGGFITGARYLQNGKVAYDSNGDMFGEEYWIQESNVPCILVARTPFQNPLRIPLDGIDSIERVTRRGEK